MFYVALIITLVPCHMIFTSSDDNTKTPPYVAPLKVFSNHQATPRDIAIRDNHIIYAFFGNVVQTTDIDKGTHTTKKYNSKLDRFRLSPDGIKLVCKKRGEARVYDQTTHIYTAIPIEVLYSFRLNHDGSMLLARTPDILQVWDLNTFEKKKEMKRPCQKILALAPDGNSYLMEDDDRNYILVDFTTHKEVALKDPPTHVDDAKFNPKHPLVVLTAMFDCASKTYGAKTGAYMRSLPDSDHMREAIFSNDGNLLIGAQSNRTYGYCIRIWNPHTSAIIHEFCCENRFPCDANTHHLALTPDNTLLASGLDDGTIRLYEMPKKVITFASEYVIQENDKKVEKNTIKQ